MSTSPATDYAPLDGLVPSLDGLYGTIFAALIALVIAVPFALGIALFVWRSSPGAGGPGRFYVVDLLAAVPSVVFGLWGAPDARAFTWSRSRRWLEDHLRLVRFFQGPALGDGRGRLTAGVVLAMWSANWWRCYCGRDVLLVRRARARTTIRRQRPGARCPEHCENGLIANGRLAAGRHRSARA